MMMAKEDEKIKKNIYIVILEILYCDYSFSFQCLIGWINFWVLRYLFRCCIRGWQYAYFGNRTHYISVLCFNLYYAYFTIFTTYNFINAAKIIHYDDKVVWFYVVLFCFLR